MIPGNGISIPSQPNIFPAGVDSTRSLSFDGVNDFVSLGSPAALTLAGDMSLSVWVKITTWRDNDYIVGDFDSGGNFSNGCLRIRSGSGNRFSWFQTGGSFTGESSTNRITDTWYHVAVVRDNTAKTITFYVNGVADGSGSYTGNPATQQGRFVGVSHSSFLGDCFIGLVDDLRFYSRKLTADEALAIYNNLVPPPVDSLAAHFGFEEGTGTSTTDSVGGVVGTLTNGVAWSTDVPTAL